MPISIDTQENTIYQVVNENIIRHLDALEVIQNTFRRQDIQKNINENVINETSFVLMLSDESSFTIRLLFSENDIDIKTSTAGSNPHILATAFTTVANNIDKIKQQLLPFYKEVLRLNNVDN